VKDLGYDHVFTTLEALEDLGDARGMDQVWELRSLPRLLHPSMP
jgi:hypothetical protein